MIYLFMAALWVALGKCTYMLVKVALTSKDRKVQRSFGDLTESEIKEMPEWLFLLFGPIVVLWAMATGAISRGGK